MPDTVAGLLTDSRSVLRFDDRAEHTAADLLADGRRVAGWLTSLGIGRGDRVAIRMHNGADYVRILTACAVGGFVAVSVNTRYGAEEADDLTERAGSSMRLETLADDWRSADPLDGTGTPDDPFVVFTTSGTTSKPKMVLHRQRSIAEHAVDIAASGVYRDDDVIMIAMPLCGVFGLTSLTGALAAGNRIVITQYDTERTGALIAAEGVTCVNGSDDMYHRLLDSGADLSSLRMAGYGRFNTSLDGIVGRAEAAGATLTGLYGMSEVQAMFTVRDPSGDISQREQAGGTMLSPRAEYRIVDGELHLRGPSVFAGYLAEGGATLDDDLTAASFDDGWFRTGDAANAQDDRTFEYTARLGDVLRLGGFLVAPAEIEAAVQELDGIDAVQVVAVDRPTGARPVAFVVGTDVPDEATVIGHVADRLARYKVPVRVIELDEFPTTPSANGTKIRKVELRRLGDAALRSGSDPE